jgi:hypothetical protein
MPSITSGLEEKKNEGGCVLARTHARTLYLAHVVDASFNLSQTKHKTAQFIPSKRDYIIDRS